MQEALKTTLVMLPGLDGTGLVFEPMLPCLSETIDTVIVRYPHDRPMSLAEHVAFARKRFPADAPFVLLAESFSGPVCLQLLANPPDNLRGVILVATFARYPSPFLLDVGRLLPQGLLLKGFSTGLLSRFFCLGKASAEAVDIFRRALSTVTLRVLSHRLQILAELPPPPEVSFKGPCLYLQATHDRLVPGRAVGPLRQCLPQLQVRQVAAPHILLLAKPATGAGLINRFIACLGDRDE